jgi:hypothetical protein
MEKALLRRKHNFVGGLRQVSLADHSTGSISDYFAIQTAIGCSQGPYPENDPFAEKCSWVRSDNRPTAISVTFRELTPSFPLGTQMRVILQNAIFQAGRLKPIFSIREIKVVGFSPKSSAAPSTPLIFQLAFRKTTKRFSRSRRRISASVRYSGSTSSPSSKTKEFKSTPVAGKSKSSAPP